MLNRGEGSVGLLKSGGVLDLGVLLVMQNRSCRSGCCVLNLVALWYHFRTFPATSIDIKNVRQTEVYIKIHRTFKLHTQKIITRPRRHVLHSGLNHVDIYSFSQRWGSCREKTEQLRARRGHSARNISGSYIDSRAVWIWTRQKLECVNIGFTKLLAQLKMHLRKKKYSTAK